MTIILYLTFIFLIFLITYYFIYLNNLTYDNLFTIILNFIFLIILPLYYFYFQDIILSIIISFLLLTSAFFLNTTIKKIFRKTKIPPIIYFLLTSYIFGNILLRVI